MRGVMSRLVSWMGRWGIVLLVIGMAACGGPRAPSEPGTIETEPPATPTAGEPEVNLEEGWTVLAEVPWPVIPGCCGMADTGPTSPEGPIPQNHWPADGFYEVEVTRTADDLNVLHLRIRRWVRCGDLPEDLCPPDAEPDPVTGEDLRIVGDPASGVLRDVPADELRVVLVPIHEFDRDEPRALDGEPGAFARLLHHGIDPAYQQWVVDVFAEGRDGQATWDDLRERSADPDFPFGLDYASDEWLGPMAYRGPFGTSLVAESMWMGEDGPSWPPGHDGLYGWRAVTLEVRDGLPILYVWAGQIGG